MPHFESELISTRSRRSIHAAPIPENLRIKNRRKLYLDANPSYFTSNDLELAEPILYDKCIRRFQTPSEREAERQKKGYSGNLEADLWRCEAETVALKEKMTAMYVPNRTASVTVPPALAFDDEDPKTREEGWEVWKYVMTLRFLKGDDGDFNYKTVDESDEWDWLERRELEDAWFNDEEPKQFSTEREGTGNTGIQDF